MVSPYMTNPFAGLQQGMQAAGGLIDMYNAPKDRAFAMEQARQKMAIQQAQLGQSQQQIDLSRQQLGQGQQRIDLASREQSRLDAAQQQEMEKYRAGVIGALAKAGKDLPMEERQKLAQAFGAMTGIDMSDAKLDDETLSNAARAYDMLRNSKKPSKLGRVFEAVDAQGNLVFAQADDKGNIQIAQGVTPTDFERQRLELQKDLAEGKLELAQEKAKAEKQKTETKTKIDTSALTEQLAQIDSLINDPNFSGAVGLIDQVTGYIGSKFGTSDGVVNRRAKRLLSSSVVKIAKSLGANPTDKDIVLLKETQPSMSDQPSVWQDWYKNDLLPVINARLSAMGQDPFSSGSGDMSKAYRMNQLKQELGL